jgi:hypothetical protein
MASSVHLRRTGILQKWLGGPRQKSGTPTCRFSVAERNLSSEKGRPGGWLRTRGSAPLGPLPSRFENYAALCFSAGRQPGLSLRPTKRAVCGKIALLILMLFTATASSAQPRLQPRKSQPPAQRSQAASKLPKPAAKPQTNFQSRRPSPAQKRATLRAVRPPAPAVRHLGPNPAVITGSAPLSQRSTGAIDGTKVHRKP